MDNDRGTRRQALVLSRDTSKIESQINSSEEDFSGLS